MVKHLKPVSSSFVNYQNLTDFPKNWCKAGISFNQLLEFIIAGKQVLTF